MLAFFQRITDILNESNIPYMLSGSVAMSIYIVPRATRDFDFIIHLKPEAAIEQLDWPYITKWINKLNLRSFNLLKHE